MPSGMDAFADLLLCQGFQSDPTMGVWGSQPAPPRDKQKQRALLLVRVATGPFALLLPGRVATGRVATGPFALLLVALLLVALLLVPSRCY